MSHFISDIDEVAYKVLQSIPQDIPQAQYSAHDQLRILEQFAIRLKLYDGLESLRRHMYPPA